MSSVLNDEITMTKRCPLCNQTKLESAFYSDGKTGKLRSACKDCCRARWKVMPRTPEQRAEYQRRTGRRSCEYKPSAARLRAAALKREVKAIIMRARKMAAERRRLTQEAARPKPIYAERQPLPSGEAVLLPLSGKHAVGEHANAIIDADMLPVLSRWKWKAKWNADRNNIYAVRNGSLNGRRILVRMHRLVAGLEHGDPMEPDHLNHYGLDNRRSNLKVGNRSANARNMRPRVAA